MPPSPPRTALRASTFIRLLARLGGAEPAQAELQPLDRLGEWFDWNQAINLSSALDGRLPDASPVADGNADALLRSATQAQQDLQRAILDERELDAALHRLTEHGQTLDYAPFRQRLQALQRAMAASSGKLRGQLREQLLVGGDALARLGALDAVMEQVLSPREARQLGALPGLLERRFDQLRPAASADTPVQLASPWLAQFRQELQQVLLGELTLRFQPVQALMAALRTA